MAELAVRTAPLIGMLARQRVLPVIEIASVQAALGVVGALLDGGIDIVEITLRSPASLDAIEAVASRYPEAVIGAGTLRTREQIAEVREAGAKFGVSPGLTPALARAARQHEFTLIPGVATPAEVMAAAEEGFEFAKFFPAESLGGAATLAAWAGPFPEMRFCPTGGIRPHTAPDYLALETVICVGGSWLAPKQAIAERDWSAITKAARAATEAI